MKKSMVAVPVGACDAQSFAREYVDPVRAFSAKTGDSWTVLLYFCAGAAPGHEVVGVDYPPECGQPPFPSTPCHAAAQKYFAREIEKGTMWLLVLTGKELTDPERVVEQRMREHGAVDLQILPVHRLTELVTVPCT